MPVAARGAVIAEQGAKIAAQERQIGELQAAVARLERIVSRNSGNSSMPPSADDLPGRKWPTRQQRRAAQRAARKRGKQPGAPGAAMCWAEPDEVIDHHHPAGACVCGADPGRFRGPGRGQLGPATGDPADARPAHPARHAPGAVLLRARARGGPPARRAGRGGIDRAEPARPDRLPAGIPARPGREVRRRLIEDVTGAAVSAGFIHSCLAKAAEAIEDVVKLIKTLITAASVAGFDETTLRG